MKSHIVMQCRMKAFTFILQDGAIRKAINDYPVLPMLQRSIEGHLKDSKLSANFAIPKS